MWSLQRSPLCNVALGKAVCKHLYFSFHQHTHSCLKDDSCAHGPLGVLQSRFDTLSPLLCSGDLGRRLCAVSRPWLDCPASWH